MAAHDRTEWVPNPSSGAPRNDPEGRPESGGAPPERLGPYRLLEEIGEGGMGVVHLALDTRGRAVAIKVLRAHVAHDSDARTRLGREVETLSRICDDRVASVIDADVMGPRPYIVTRYVHGQALDEAVDEHGAFGPEALLRLARGTAEAIRAIHACGVVHRDVKPGNVLLEDGEPVLIDFGIAHLQDDVRHTVGGLVMGTPGYLSPELVEGAAITDATDWWGWAATITYAASGRPPFGRGRMDAVLSRVRAGEVDLEGVDPRLAPLLRASLSPRPSQRPHADEVIDALERFAAGEAATVPTPSGGPWDGGGDEEPVPPPVGSTQVLLERDTNVLPRTPAGAAEAKPERWAPPGPTAAPPPSVVGEPRWFGDDAWEAGGGEDDADLVEREGDPRIGMAMRTGLLAAVAAGWLAAFSAWPAIAAIVLGVWSAIARATDRSVTGLVLRRYDHGRRRSDLPWAIGLSPWHLLLGVVATVVSLLLPLAVTLAGIFASALLLAGARGAQLDPGDPITLVIGGAIGLTMLWWGPGGASLRRGSRSMARRLVPEGLATKVTTAVAVVFAVAVAAVSLSHGAPLLWAPFTGNPLGP
ncbi:serine/threonine protein kinase [Humibacillus sp. DSM 29435]|uniref:serine/threonine-protein kinase n=1 Tax=Humibacillus sp. DSM 29435 TaxID=1869167 RepID=UPI000873466D|nr:serine/threonine-protein kinase [Humibacillus sp. DSM 29435]OFE15843.1 serine/threonine protein kinase [Humibacillus sp. DSM 29435]